MLEGKAVVGEAEMLQKMQQDALHLSAKAPDLFDVTESIDMACFIKKMTSQTDLYWYLFQSRISTMHSGDGFEFICDPQPWLLLLLRNCQSCNIAIYRAVEGNLFSDLENANA
ncbi:hypothetical protein Dsin_027686 [Dipteronia sinensis]|uniref:Uncharacterized protein n=1 Tax=Dipteronia sinensis TaxID=43782 RepID=A0AAE0DTQ3_9ROSI|nr:hypothetical protein Dsin_027686 [Dipteronia sinensis]